MNQQRSRRFKTAMERMAVSSSSSSRRAGQGPSWGIAAALGMQQKHRWRAAAALSSQQLLTCGRERDGDG